MHFVEILLNTFFGIFLYQAENTCYSLALIVLQGLIIIVTCVGSVNIGPTLLSFVVNNYNYHSNYNNNTCSG